MPDDQSSTSQPQQPGPSVLPAPWRDVYMQELSAALRSPGDEPPGTFFEQYWSQPEADEANHVVARVGDGNIAGMLVLNKFPYANGHLLVALAQPRPTLLEYEPAQREALWRLVDLACLLVQRTLEPQGLNVGMNQGAAAGAGVPGHLHMHVVPRWGGDVNFMAVVGDVRVIPCALAQMWTRYKEQWQSMASANR